MNLPRWAWTIIAVVIVIILFVILKVEHEYWQRWIPYYSGTCQLRSKAMKRRITALAILGYLMAWSCLLYVGCKTPDWPPWDPDTTTTTTVPPVVPPVVDGFDYSAVQWVSNFQGQNAKEDLIISGMSWNGAQLHLEWNHNNWPAFGDQACNGELIVFYIVDGFWYAQYLDWKTASQLSYNFSGFKDMVNAPEPHAINGTPTKVMLLSYDKTKRSNILDFPGGWPL
jgi:hypothetical protein